MHKSLENLKFIQDKVIEIVNKRQQKIIPKIIVVTKTFSPNLIKPLLDAGHNDFGENKVQEAETKWPEMRVNHKNIKLHMIGKLQSNKVNKAVKLFDYIHSLDNEKLASKLSQHMKELDKKIKFFIQVNIGKEEQKSGVTLKEVNSFYNYCTKELHLEVIGLMCIPPINIDTEDHFKILKETAEKLNLKDLSMGMSSDYEKAIENGSTYLRLGTAILGERNLI